MGLEQHLFPIFLPLKPDESGYKRIDHVLERRALMNDLELSRSFPRFSRQLFEEHVPAEVLREANALLESDPTGLYNANMAYLREGVFLKAGPFHLDNWMRDNFYSLMLTKMFELQMHSLSKFDSDGTGHVESKRFFPGARRKKFDDESTLISIIWRAMLNENGMKLSKAEMETYQKRIDWAIRHETDNDGYYYSKSPITGKDVSWHDTFLIDGAENLRYVQGLYSLALLAADDMGLKTSRRFAKAAQRYRETSSGIMTMGKEIDYVDGSVMTAEYLANQFFTKTIVENPKVVRETVDAFRANEWKIIAKRDGTHLRAEQFNDPFQPGDYHNGGIWDLFTAMAVQAAQNNGEPSDPFFWVGMKNFMLANDFPEYSRPDGTINESRIMNCWNYSPYLIAKSNIKEARGIEYASVFMHKV